MAANARRCPRLVFTPLADRAARHAPLGLKNRAAGPMEALIVVKAGTPLLGEYGTARDLKKECLPLLIRSVQPNSVVGCAPLVDV